MHTLIEFARNMLKLEKAHSSEFNPNSPHSVIALLDVQRKVTKKGGTMRLGAQACQLTVGSQAGRLYGSFVVNGRHRHRYEFNNAYRERFEKAGFPFSGNSADGKLVEVIELKDHPFFLASQFHPEFLSKPHQPHPLFKGLIAAAPCVLRELGADVIVAGIQPDGKNINKECGSMHPQHFCAKVREFRADVGIAHDGDADRVLMCDETGTLVDGDDIMAIAALDMLAQGALAEKTLVATIMSNAGLDAAIQAAGGTVLRTGVGDKLVIDEMLRGGFNFGGEQSGHLIFRDHSTTGDGLVAALQMLRIMRATGKPLSQLAKCWTRFPQLVTNVMVREKKPFEQLDGVSKLVAEAEAEMQSQGGRVLLRYSGTEPKARLLMEGRDAKALQAWSQKICDAIKRQVGA